MKAKLPNINTTYHFFEDGKINPYRHDYIKIDKIYPYYFTPYKIKRLVKQEQKQCSWLYAKHTDYIIKGHKVKDPNEIHWFIRTTDGQWFSMGPFNAGLLDVTGEIFHNACKYYEDNNLDNFALSCEEFYEN